MLAAVVLACIAASCYFAFAYGWSRGANPTMAWACGLFAAGLDLTKSTILVRMSGAPGSEWRPACAIFWALTAMSLWAAYGNIVNQRRATEADRAAAAATYNLKNGELQQLQIQHRGMTFTETTEEVVAAARNRAQEAESQRALECDGSRGKAGNICREREADKRKADDAVTATVQERAKTDQARALDQRIAVLQLWMDNNKEIVRKGQESADPEWRIITDAIMFAVCVEIGSGVLPWLLFGHGRREERKTHDIALTPVPDTDETIRQRFFDTAVIPRKEKFVNATPMYRAYVLWCNDNGHVPMSIHEFGTGAPWPKKKVGAMRYLDCELVGRYAPRQLRVVAAT